MLQEFFVHKHHTYSFFQDILEYENTRISKDMSIFLLFTKKPKSHEFFAKCSVLIINHWIEMLHYKSFYLKLQVPSSLEH